MSEATRRWRPRAGKKLRAELDALLAAEAAKVGVRLRWDEREAQHIDAACRAADRVELLQRLLDEEAAGQRRPSVMVAVSGEMRLLDRDVADHLGRVQIGDFPVVKSPQHQSAAVARWGANRPRKRA